MKLIPDVYTFDASAKTITCADFTTLERISTIQNLTTGDTIYDFGEATRGGSLVGSVLTLDFDTTAMGDLDKLQIVLHPNTFTENGVVSVGNAMKKFRSGFFDGIDADTWTEEWAGTHQSIATVTGDAAGARYLQIALSPEDSDVSYTLTSNDSFRLPHRFGYGLTVSQRIVGQEAFAGLVGVGADDVVEKNTTVSDKAISGTVSITSNVATINFATRHGFVGSDRVVVYGNTEKRLNVGPVPVTISTPYAITVPCTLANGTYTAGGFVAWADALGYAKNGYGYLAENTTVTNLSAVTRRNGGRFMSTNTTTASTTATQTNGNPFTRGYRATADNELFASMEEVLFMSRTANSTSGVSGVQRYTETLPTEEKKYKLQFRGGVLKNATKVVAKIVTIAKTGTTTATVTTAAAHGLVAGDYVQIYGVRDITNFPNLTTSTVVASTPTSTTFTIIIGTASTNSSYGGVVVLNQGSVLYPGAFNFSIQSIVVSDNILTATLNTTASGFTNGQTVYLGGLQGGLSAYDGLYTVGRTNASTVELVPLIEGGTITTVTSTNTGGSIAIATDVRIHYARQLEYTRHVVEIGNARGVTDGSRTLPVALTATATVALSSVTADVAIDVQPNIPTLVADVASAALTTTTTTAAITPTWGNVYQVNIPVTAVTGTGGPTLSVRIEESDDTGTNWRPVYTFPTITATGIYRSPMLALRGNRLRYVQTVTGTSPSFTRAVNRLQRADVEADFLPFTLTSAASTNATSVFNGQCRIGTIVAFNTNAAARYLKIYDKASAPTVGTDTPIFKATIPGGTPGTGFVIPVPRTFLANGFAFAITTGVANSDTGAVAADEIIINGTYQP